MNEIEARTNYEWQEVRRDIDTIGGCGNSIWHRASGMFYGGASKEEILETVRRLKAEKLRENPYYPDKNPDANIPSGSFIHDQFNQVKISSTPKPSGWADDIYRIGKFLEEIDKKEAKNKEIKKQEKSSPKKPLGPVQIPLF